MNVYDSSRIRDLLVAANYEQTDDIKKAKVVVLVTCAIREKAQEKVFNQLFSWKAKNQYSDDAIVCLGGCVSSLLGEQILKRAPMVDIVFGPQTIHRLISMIHEVENTNNRLVDISFPEVEKFDFLPNPNAHDNASAFVTIMEGCSNFCTYCVVPYTRGREVSRSVESVLAEINHFVGQGVQEIHLIGQNVNSYQGTYENGDQCNFSELLYLIAAIDGVKRIRFTTSNPHDFTDELIQAFEDLPQITNAIHLPVQNGSNKILKAMNRKYTREQYIELVRKIRNVRPDIFISTDIIVGFPGETEEDFLETMNLIEEIKFDQSFSFVFSPRPGTPAAKLEDNTPLEVKKERLYRLQNLINNQAQQYSREMLGTIQEVLVHGTSIKQNIDESADNVVNTSMDTSTVSVNVSEMSLRARTDNNRTVNFIGDISLLGKFVKVKITDVKSHTLTGELVQ